LTLLMLMPEVDQKKLLGKQLRTNDLPLFLLLRSVIDKAPAPMTSVSPVNISFGL